MGRINKTQIIKSRVRLDEMLTIKEAEFSQSFERCSQVFERPSLIRVAS